MATPEDEIRAIEEHFINASLEEAMAVMSEDHVRFDFIPPLQYRGKKAVRGVFEAFFANAKNAKGEFLSLDVVADERIGCASSVQRVVWSTPDGKPGSATVRVTHVFRKTNGAWEMFHSHVSAPIHGGTGKAEMNLTK